MTQSKENERELVQLLLQLQLLTRDQITEALSYQCRLPPSQFRSLRDILVDMELISESEMRQAEQSFAAPVDLRDSFQLAMDEMLKQADQLQHQFPPVVPEPPRTRPIAQPPAEPLPSPPAPAVQPPAVPQAAIKPLVPPGSGVQAAGAFARRSPQTQASGWGTVSSQQPFTGQPLVPAAPQSLQLGEILLKQKALEEWQLAKALEIQQATQPRPRLGTLLVRLGYADKQTVARALSLQVQSRQ